MNEIASSKDDIQHVDQIKVGLEAEVKILLSSKQQVVEKLSSTIKELTQSQIQLNEWKKERDKHIRERETHIREKETHIREREMLVSQWATARGDILSCP